MESNYNQIEEMADEIRHRLNQEQEALAERSAQLSDSLKLLDVTVALQAENRQLQEQRNSRQRQLEEANQRLAVAEKKLDEEKQLRQTAEMRLKEMGQLSAGVVRESGQMELVKALQTFLNKSKRKRIEKRAAIKEMILELCTANKMTLPDDLAEQIQNFDDMIEKPDSAQVSVGGDYVLNKHVDNVVEHVDAGANGITVNKEK